MFDQDGADEKLKDWMSRHRGQRDVLPVRALPAGAPAGAAAARGARVVPRHRRPEQQVLPRAGRSCDGRRLAAVSLQEGGGAGGNGSSRRAASLPAAAADRALLEAILGERRVPARVCCSRTSARCARLAADPWLRRAKPPDAIAREVRAAAAGAADLAERAARPAPRPALRDAAARRARARVGDDRGGRARAVGRSPTPAWTSAVDVLRRRAARASSARRAPTTARRSRFVVMAMGKLGGEELNFSSDVDVCYFYSTDAGAAGRGVAAPLLRRAVAARVGGAGAADRRRDGVPGRSAPAARGAQRAAVQLARRGRGVLRDLRADLGAAGVAARPARRRAIARWATSCSRSSSRSSIRAASTRA